MSLGSPAMDSSINKNNPAFSSIIHVFKAIVNLKVNDIQEGQAHLEAAQGELLGFLTQIARNQVTPSPTVCSTAIKPPPEIAALSPPGYDAQPPRAPTLRRAGPIPTMVCAKCHGPFSPGAIYLRIYTANQ